MEYLKPISKAIAGALAAVVVKYFVDHDILIDATQLGSALEYIITALIGLVVVYVAPRNREV